MIPYIRARKTQKCHPFRVKIPLIFWEEQVKAAETARLSYIPALKALFAEDREKCCSAGYGRDSKLFDTVRVFAVILPGKSGDLREMV